MQRLLTSIVNDIRAGKNIEAYIVITAAIVIGVLSLVQDLVPVNIQLAVLLGAVAVLVFKSVTQQRPTLDLDDVLHDRQSFGPFRDFIHDGKVLWIYGASAVNVIRSADVIESEILDRGGELRVLFQNPDEKASVDILLQQLDKYYDLLTDIQQVKDTLKRMKHSPKNHNIECRMVPYSPGFSMTIVDPDGRDGRLIVEFYGYNNEKIQERMHIEIRRDSSQHWFEYWKKQYLLMWDSATASEAAVTATE